MYFSFFYEISKRFIDNNKIFWLCCFLTICCGEVADEKLATRNKAVVLASILENLNEKIFLIKFCITIFVEVESAKILFVPGARRIFCDE